MIRRSKRKFKNGIINKKLILLLTVTCVTLGIGAKTYINKKNNSKNSLVYAGIQEKDNNSSSSGTSSGFTPKFKDENKKSNEDKEEKKSNKHIDINTDTELNKNGEAKKINISNEPKEGKNSDSSNTSTENPEAKDNKEFFKNDVFMGDSITEALIYYEVLNEKNVCAKKGININNAKNEVEKINMQNPRNIYVLYGVNDMNNTVPSKWFVDHYRTLIHKVKEKFPKSNIYIQSVMPVLPMVEQKTPTMTNSYINECNLGVMKMAKEENVKFLNVNSILNESNKNLYEDDGIHFKPNFYPVWLNYIKNRVQ